MAVKHTAEVTISDLSDAANVDLSSYAYVFPANKDGAASAGSCSFSVICMIGSTQVDCSVDNSEITKPSAGVTTSVSKATGSMTPVVTVTVTSSLTQTVLNGGSTISVPVAFSYQNQTVTVWKDFNLALAKTGATGAVAYNYFLTADPSAVVRNEDGTYSAASITARTTRGQTGNPAAYSAWYWAHYTTDGSTWTQISKSTAAQASLAVTIPTNVSGIRAIRITAHTASPTDANRVDSVTIPVIDAGATGPQGEAAYTVLLTDESHTFAATADGKAIATSIETRVVAYKGATQVAATIGTVTGTISGKLTATVKSGTQSTTNATLTIAATATLDTRQGELTIPITVDGKSCTKVFSWSLSPTGETGAQGPQGDPGEDGVSMSITSNNGTTIRNSSGSTTLTAHVWKSGAEVTGSALAAMGTIKWYVDGTYQSGCDGTTFEVQASAVTSKAVVCAKLEG